MLGQNSVLFHRTSGCPETHRHAGDGRQEQEQNAVQNRRAFGCPETYRHADDGRGRLVVRRRGRRSPVRFQVWILRPPVGVSRAHDSWATLSPHDGGPHTGGSSAEVLRLSFHLPRGHFWTGVIQVLLVDFLERLFQELEVPQSVLREREEERLWARTQRLHLASTDSVFGDVHIWIWPSAGFVRLLVSLIGAYQLGKTLST